MQLMDRLLLVGRKLALALLGLPREILLELLLVPGSFHRKLLSPMLHFLHLHRDSPHTDRLHSLGKFW